MDKALAVVPKELQVRQGPALYASIVLGSYLDTPDEAKSPKHLMDKALAVVPKELQVRQALAAR